MPACDLRYLPELAGSGTRPGDRPGAHEPGHPEVAGHDPGQAQSTAASEDRRAHSRRRPGVARREPGLSRFVAFVIAAALALLAAVAPDPGQAHDALRRTLSAAENELPLDPAAVPMRAREAIGWHPQ